MAFDSSKSYYIVNSATQKTLIAIDSNLQFDALNTFLEPTRNSNEIISRDRWMFVESATSPKQYQIVNCVTSAKSLQVSASDDKSVIFDTSSNKASNLWKVSPTDNPNHFRIISTEKDGKTLQIVSGKPVIGAAQQNNDVWVLESFNNVWAYNNMLGLGGDGRMVNWISGSWHALPFTTDGSSPEKMVNATYDTTGKLWGVNASGQLKKWNPPSTTPAGESVKGNWTNFADSSWKLFSITFNSKNIKYASNHSGKVGHYDGTKKVWTPLADTTPMVHVAFNGTDVLHGVGTDGKVYKYDGSKWAQGAEQGTTAVVSVAFDPNVPELTYFVGKKHDLQVYDHLQKKSFSLGVIGNYNLRHVFFFNAGVFGAGSLEMATYQPPHAFPQPANQQEKDAYAKITGGLAKFRSLYTLNGSLPDMVTAQPPTAQDAATYTKVKQQISAELNHVQDVRELYQKLSFLFTDATLAKSMDLAAIQDYFNVPSSASLKGSIVSYIVSMGAGIVFSEVATQAAPVIGAAVSIYGLLFDNVFQASKSNPLEKFADLFKELNAGFIQYKVVLESKFRDYLSDWGKLQTVAKMNVDLDMSGATKLLNNGFTLAILQSLMPDVYSIQRAGSKLATNVEYAQNNHDGTFNDFSLDPAPNAGLLTRLWELGTAKEDLYLDQYGWNLPLKAELQMGSVELFIYNCTVNELNCQVNLLNGIADNLKDSPVFTGTIPPLDVFMFSAFSGPVDSTTFVQLKATITDNNGPKPKQVFAVEVDNKGDANSNANVSTPTVTAPCYVDQKTLLKQAQNIMSLKTVKFNLWEFPPSNLA